jgi:hypothetical protein
MVWLVTQSMGLGLDPGALGAFLLVSAVPVLVCEASLN